LSHDTYWEPTIFNLGHACRIMRQYDMALHCFSRCVALCPDKFSTYSALAYTKHLTGDLDSAISYYHQALALKPEDPFSTEMLNNALQDQIESSSTSSPPSAAHGRTKKYETLPASARRLVDPKNRKSVDFALPPSPMDTERDRSNDDSGMNMDVSTES
jgi:tetratricopeptide (TPR) repeat protein